MNRIYDFAGIGIGPFNLGLAAMSAPIKGLNAIFFDEHPRFSWHPGLLLDEATLQVAFYADLVTLADPCSRFSFLSYLKARGRLIPFSIREQAYITRREYLDYCEWAAAQLPTLRFGRRVVAVHYDPFAKMYRLQVRHGAAMEEYGARKLVIGIGSRPFITLCAGKIRSQDVFHSEDYLRHKESLLGRHSVTIIGSGQSAAEIFDDLLSVSERFSQGLYWFTRARRFFPMDYSKLTLEMSTPDYIDYFYRLPPEQKPAVLRSQAPLYRGINRQLISRIYDRLYAMSIAKTELPVNLYACCELTGMAECPPGFRLEFVHKERKQAFAHYTEAVILATGYYPRTPAFLNPIWEQVAWDADGWLQVGPDYSIDRAGGNIFVQNAEGHTHGFNAADLSLGPYRNAVIINAILGEEYYHISRKNTFQRFGVPEKAELPLREHRALVSQGART